MSLSSVFHIAGSGMSAQSTRLNTISSNIANAGTVGFKQSRAEFADVYASAVLGAGKNQQGSGVLLGNVSQLFNQGNINYTQNPLDLAINGNGFFQVSNNGALSYTRAGFANVQGLTPVGKTQWVQSLESGEPVRNPGGTGTLGAIQSGALEDSNVELSDQLVNLIVAQRNYQANAKTIETNSAITQTIINIR